jgi:glutaredoxin-related protein
MLQDETSFLTLPQVFVDDDTFLGGYDNIIELHQNGKFNKLFGLED